MEKVKKVKEKREKKTRSSLKTVEYSVERLKKFLNENGIKKKYFATELGITNNLFSKMMTNPGKIPKKYWVKIEKLTRGYVTADDFLNDLVMRLRKEILVERQKDL